MTVSMTITGAQFREFYQNHWPAGCWHEDSEYEIDDDLGVYVLPDDAVLKIDCLGYVVTPGKDGNHYRPFKDVWEEWAGTALADEIMTWRVPADLRSQVVEFMSGLGLKQVGQTEPDQTPKM